MALLGQAFMALEPQSKDGFRSLSRKLLDDACQITSVRMTLKSGLSLDALSFAVAYQTMQMQDAWPAVQQMEAGGPKPDLLLDEESLGNPIALREVRSGMLEVAIERLLRVGATRKGRIRDDLKAALLKKVPKFGSVGGREPVRPFPEPPVLLPAQPPKDPEPGGDQCESRICGIRF